MPEYLAPGVFMEEVSYRSKSIEGVSTTTTGFVGPARFGPTDGVPEIVTSLAEFEAAYGDGQDVLGGPELPVARGARVLRAGRQAPLRESRRRRRGARPPSSRSATPRSRRATRGSTATSSVTIRLVADPNRVVEYTPPGAMRRSAASAASARTTWSSCGEDTREVEMLASGALQIKGAGADRPRGGPGQHGGAPRHRVTGRERARPHHLHRRTAGASEGEREREPRAVPHHRRRRPLADHGRQGLERARDGARGGGARPGDRPQAARSRQGGQGRRRELRAREGRRRRGAGRGGLCRQGHRAPRRASPRWSTSPRSRSSRPRRPPAPPRTTCWRSRRR